MEVMEISSRVTVIENWIEGLNRLGLAGERVNKLKDRTTRFTQPEKQVKNWKISRALEKCGTLLIHY